MRKRRPRVASPDEVRITREGEAAHIEFADGSIASTRLTLGPKIARMSDAEILECYNDCVRAMDYSRATYRHIPVEIPVGKPQIRYDARCRQWVPQGDVLRCEISDSEEGEPIIHVDEQELSWEEFGRLLCTHAGWGMRLVFVPEDRLDELPQIVVREPEKGERE